MLLRFIEREECDAVSSYKDQTKRSDWRLDWRDGDREGYELVQRANVLLGRKSPARPPR